MQNAVVSDRVIGPGEELCAVGTPALQTREATPNPLSLPSTFFVLQ